MKLLMCASTGLAMGNGVRFAADCYSAPHWLQGALLAAVALLGTVWLMRSYEIVERA